VTQYKLAYINQSIHAGDNDRGVGCDNQHGHHRKHYFGLVSAVELKSFEATEDQFQDASAVLGKAP
jgi:hypothetical protein